MLLLLAVLQTSLLCWLGVDCGQAACRSLRIDWVWPQLTPRHHLPLHSSALGDRARKLDKGILIVRFEVRLIHILN